MFGFDDNDENKEAVEGIYASIQAVALIAGVFRMAHSNRQGGILIKGAENTRSTMEKAKDEDELPAEMVEAGSEAMIELLEKVDGLLNEIGEAVDVYNEKFGHQLNALEESPASKKKSLEDMLGRASRPKDD